MAFFAIWRLFSRISSFILLVKFSTLPFNKTYLQTSNIDSTAPFVQTIFSSFFMLFTVVIIFLVESNGTSSTLLKVLSITSLSNPILLQNSIIHVSVGSPSKIFLPPSSPNVVSLQSTATFASFNTSSEYIPSIFSISSNDEIFSISNSFPSM